MTDPYVLSVNSILPREVDPLVYNMTMEDPKGASFAGVGGLGDQIRELREVSILQPVQSSIETELEVFFHRSLSYH